LFIIRGARMWSGYIDQVKINEAVNFVQTTLKDKVQTYGNYR